jgi:tetratricopeptide (TPR) repeat protein
VESWSTDPSRKKTAETAADGTYSLVGLQEGVYTLRVTKPGHPDGRVNSLFLRSKEDKKVDLMLGSGNATKPGMEQAEFFDEPQFTVSGVTDVANLGGHGSDTVVRTREALAKETVSLGSSPSPNPPAISAGSKKSLEESAEKIRTELAQHDRPELHHQLAGIAEELGDPLEAVRQYQRAAQMDPSETNLFDWGSEVLLHHAPEPAMEIFSKGNALFPRSQRMLLGLAVTSFARGANEEAIQRASQAADLNPNDPTPYVFLGKMGLAEAKPSNQALERLQRFVALQPGSAEARYYYAVTLWKNSKVSQNKAEASQAESLLIEALHLDPKLAAADLQLGIVHSEQMKYSDAISNYRQAIQLDPKLVQAHYRLAQAYRQQGQSDQAKEELRLYEQLSKESAQETERDRQQIRQLVYTLRAVEH